MTVDWDYFISESGKKWEPSASQSLSLFSFPSYFPLCRKNDWQLILTTFEPVRGLFPLEKLPGMVSLLAGKPNAETFPFSSIKVSLKPLVNDLHLSFLHIETLCDEE